MIRITLMAGAAFVGMISVSNANQEVAGLRSVAKATQLKILICQKSADGESPTCDDEHAVRVKWVPIPPNLEMSYCMLEYGQTAVAEKGLIDEDTEYITTKCARREKQ